MVRLGLAVTRGLLLDLVATGDDKGVDAAAASFVALLPRPEGTSIGTAKKAVRQADNVSSARSRSTGSSPGAP
jgi:hypothetical protein